MPLVRIEAGPFAFETEEQAAPKISAPFLSLLPYRERRIHARRSGQGCWIPPGQTGFGLGVENATRFPAPGHFLLYRGGFSETEILFAYGGVRFAGKTGQLAGNHFLTVARGQENLETLGKLTLRTRRAGYRLQASRPTKREH